MQVDCPECAASLEGAPGAEIVCPACMTPFLVPASARAVRAFDVQRGPQAGDAVLPHQSRYAIREAIYTGRLTAAAKVRHDGGKWELIGGYPEFAQIFRLLGGDLAPMAGTRKLAGWRHTRGGADEDSLPPIEALPAGEGDAGDPPTFDSPFARPVTPMPTDSRAADGRLRPVDPPAAASASVAEPARAAQRPRPPASAPKSPRLPLWLIGGLLLLLGAALAFAV
jgi:hypothetical protein